MLVEPALHVTN